MMETGGKVHIHHGQCVLCRCVGTCYFFHDVACPEAKNTTNPGNDKDIRLHTYFIQSLVHREIQKPTVPGSPYIVTFHAL